MYRDQLRFGKDPTQVVKAATDTFMAPFWHWKEPRKVFVCSWSDFFIEEAGPWRDAAWQIIHDLAPQHTYQILTKRPERIAQCLPADWGKGYPNVWLGVTAENQDQWDLRVGKLRRTPAAVHFVSVEPMLSAIDATDDLPEADNPNPPDMSWVIIGTESGPQRRPARGVWVQNLVNQCRAVQVPVFVKQVEIFGRVSHNPAEWPESIRYQEFPQVEAQR
jgi:protein gp37